MKLSNSFRGRSLLWATTYSFDPDLFDQFILRRMDEPPRNAVVLADHARLASAWEEIGAEEPWRLRAANSRYLVRGVRTSRSFHPKTYLAADGKRGTLFVGSGNLTLGGIEQGDETFVRFDSDRGGLDAILAWAGWITALVEGLDDAVVDRWRELRRVATWLRGDAPTSGGFVQNLSRSLLDQLEEAVDEPPATLYLTAPFFDERAQAFREVVDRLEPRAVRLYLCGDASVDGEHLHRHVEDLSMPVEVLRYDADFVHAKLIAAAYDSGEGLVLSGSANLSQAALLWTSGVEARGNFEAGVISPMPREEIDKLFEPPHLRASPLEPKELLAFRFDPGVAAAAAPLLALTHARFTADDHIEVGIEGDVASFQVLELAHADGVMGLDGMRSAAPFPGDREEAIVWLVDGSGERASNSVPVDDPDALRKQLSDRAERTDKPPELDLSDVETPIGQMLVQLQASCIFDFDELPKPSVGAAEQGEVEVEDDSLWERLQQENLALDPRVAAYRAFGSGKAGADDPLLLMLEAMLGGFPTEVALRGVGPPVPDDPGKGENGDEEEGEQGDRRWAPERRLQLRLFNVLKRWSVALADPRLFLISKAAGARNYSALLAAIHECWAREYLTEDRIRLLLEALFSAFIKGERSRGYLWLLKEDERQAVVDAIPADARELAMALAFAMFHDETVAHPFIFVWQSFLVPGLDAEIFRTGARAAELVSEVFEEEISSSDLEKRVREVADYTNDERWCARLAQELGFRRVTLGIRHFQGARIVVTVDEGTDLLHDPRMPRVVREALEYRPSEIGVFVETAGSPMPRLRVERDGKAGVVRERQVDLIAEVLTWDELLRLDAGSLPFADLSDARARAA